MICISSAQIIYKFIISVKICIKCLSSQAWNNGSIAVFHGVPDAKTAHIFQMNQATKSRNAPNCKPIPSHYRSSFGNFYKPAHKVRELQAKMYSEVNVLTLQFGWFNLYDEIENLITNCYVMDGRCTTLIIPQKIYDLEPGAKRSEVFSRTRVFALCLICFCQHSTKTHIFTQFSAALALQSMFWSLCV